MPRYYEENALIEFVKQSVPHINGETTLECVERAIHNAPTADVVPKSEVDKWKNAAKIANKEREKLSNHYFIDTQIGNGTPLQRANQELAREIFAEIETIVDNNTYKSYLPNSSLWSKEYKIKQIITELAELKKKYAEVINNGHA